MQESKSERTRMQAAMRLCDVLLAREAREQAEQKAAVRTQERTAETPDTDESADAPAPAETSSEDERVDAAFAFLKTSNAG